MTAIELESLSPKYKLKASDDKTEFIIDDKVLKQSVVLREMMGELRVLIREDVERNIY